MYRILGFVRIILPALAVTLLLAGVVGAVCPPGDLSRDCDVDFDDIRLYAEQWLQESGCFDPDYVDPNCADFDGVDGVNMFDFALLTRNWRQVGQPIMINEFMASNSSFVQDPQLDYDDWLELYNAGDETIDVGGMYLTNDIGNPTMWRIPDDVSYSTTIPSHGHLWIWADKDAGDSPGLHADFKIDADGGEIALFDSNAVALVDSVAFDRQTTDISYGRYPDGAVNWRYFGTPTPGGINEGAYLGVIDDPLFSHKRGFYDETFTLTIACDTEGVLIYYTTDGTEPGVSDGRYYSGMRYTNPFPITETMYLQARAVKAGWQPTPVKTQTYIFDADEATRSLPIVSLVGNEEETFYEPDGIMAIEGGYYSGGVWTSDGPDSYNNIMLHGMAYERPVSFEFFNTPDGADFQVDCGIRVHGSDWMRPRYLRCEGDLPYGWTNDCKIAFRLYFRSIYGENRLEYPLFPYGLDEFESIVLRSGHNDRQNPFVRDELLRRLHLDMGNAASTGTHANVFVNGEYKGYYNPCEHIKDSFCQEYYNSNEEWDVMTMSGVRDGDRTSWDEMTNYARNHDLTNPIHYFELAQRLDIPAFADYLILELWCANWDWPSNNWSAASERSDEGIWRFFIWDAEGGLTNGYINTVYFDRLNSWGDDISTLYRSLKVSDDFKYTFTDRLFKHFYNYGALTEANIEKRFVELRDEVDEVIYRRTGAAVDEYIINTWAPDRLSIFLDRCETEGMFTYTGPELRVNDVYQHGGYASSGDSVTIHNPHGFGDVYYTIDGNDPRVPMAAWTPGAMVRFVDEDSAKTVIVPTESVGAPLGSILYEYWTDITGTSVADLTSDPDYPGNPDGSYYVTEFQGPTNWNDYYGSRISGYLHPPQTGDYTFWIATDDSGELWLSTDADPANKSLIASVSSWTSSRAWDWHPEQESTPVTLAAGQRYYIEAMMKEGASGDNIAVAWYGPEVGIANPTEGDPPIEGQYLSGSENAWTTLDYDDASWQNLPSGTVGVGYETRPTDSVNYVGLFDLDLEAEMFNARTTCYIRIPFFATTVDLMQLTLDIRYDDGFVAYINGQRVASRNFDATPSWDSQADFSHADSQAIYLESIDLSDHIDTLRTGENVLAIQGLNVSAGSSDFLISAELYAYEAEVYPSGSISPSAVEYTGAWTLDKSTEVKTRMLYGETWSALTEATFAVGPVAENLRITEIMYNPQDSNDPNDPNEEFVELKNIGSTAINLNQVKFTNGIDFTFGDLDLSPGEHVLVVKDREAFAAAQPGFSGLLAGEYSGSLDNGGEEIELQDADGRAVCRFDYDDDWREITDGGGHSLAIIDPTDALLLDRPAGLAAYWKFDDGAGTAATDSVAGNNGLIHGDPTWTDGQLAGALNLETSDDYVSLPPIPALNEDNVTVAMWVRLGELTGMWNPLLLQHNTDGDGYYLYIIDRKPVFSLASGGNSNAAIASQPIAMDEWYHIAGTNDGANLRIYVNGYLEASDSSLGRTGASYDAYIGHDHNSSAYYSGLIDDTRIYDRPLSNYEIAQVIDPLLHWSEKDSWRASAYPGGSPGWDDTGILPNPGAIVISEVLAHSHDTDPDWIEFYNTTDAQIDIGGWYLSDSEPNLMKYRFADGTKIGAGEYIVLTEDANFGEASADPGSITPFAFSENGDQAYLSSGQADALTGYRVIEDFGASPRGASFGRYYKTSTDNYNFVPLDYNTPGERNSYPAVGPIVINEIMYNPDWPAGGNYTNNQYEYIELHNISDQPVVLYDDEVGEPWQFTDGISYTFASVPGIEVPAGGYVVIAKDITAYLARYGTPPFGTILLGPYDGRLSDGGEKLQLARPGDVDEFAQRSYIRIDRVNYSDGSHARDIPGNADLWPTEPDGAGQSLSRIAPGLYGNDPNNWNATTPSPGAANP